ncbi:MAG: hypothetical protein E7330_04550 [Clostridiales bacterium]|nr:hypothetical protein [Clostridiales bacterium]
MPFPFRRVFALCCVFAALFSFCGVSFAAPETVPPVPTEEILSVGDFGDDVTALQFQLRALGFYEGEVAGLFDGRTHNAVVSLQQFLGVEADGAFGPITAGAYFAALESGLLAFPEPNPEENTAAGSLSGLVIGIDPGHQLIPDAGLEAIAPGVDRTKQRQSPGGTGAKTGTAEHRINLIIALKLRDLLLAEGAEVIMTRETGDVSLSNRERALLMNEAEVDVWVRLHCDSASSARESGARVLVPSRTYNAAIYRESFLLGKCLQESFTEATGVSMPPLRALMDQTGFNWSAVPVAAVEMGMLSNPQEDIRLNRDSYQTSCAAGIFNGLITYFELLETIAGGKTP